MIALWYSVIMADFIMPGTQQPIIVITLATKRRREGTVIILCVCVCVCVFAKFCKNYEHWWLELDTGRLQIIQGSKVTTGFW